MMSVALLYEQALFCDKVSTTCIEKKKDEVFSSTIFPLNQNDIPLRMKLYNLNYLKYDGF